MRALVIVVVLLVVENGKNQWISSRNTLVGNKKTVKNNIEHPEKF